MLDLSITLVVIAHVVVSLLLILVILMQRPKQEGLGAAFGSGMTDAAWGARTTDVLQKGTVYLGSLFFLFSLVLAILMGKKNAVEGKNLFEDGATSEVVIDAPKTLPADIVPEPITPPITAPAKDETPAPSGAETPVDDPQPTNE